MLICFKWHTYFHLILRYYLTVFPKQALLAWICVTIEMIYNNNEVSLEGQKTDVNTDAVPLILIPFQWRVSWQLGQL